jgi:hypothetical protein
MTEPLNTLYSRRAVLEFWGGSTSLIGLDAQYNQEPLFVAEQFLLDNGQQLGRLHEYLESGLLPALRSAVGGRQLVLEAVVSAHQPQILFLQEFANLEAWRATGKQLASDSALLAKLRAWESSGEPYSQRNLAIYASPHYQSQQAIPTDKPLYELRTYQAPSMWQANGLHERFAGPEIPIFHRCGIHPALYLSGIAGAQLPNLTYLTPFASLAEREAAWTKFQADPEWLRVKQDSVDKHGYTPRVINIALYKLAPYSIAT